MDFLLDYKAKYNLTNEFLHYIALCGVFSPRRNIVKHWDTNEELFLSLVKLDGKLGLDHFMQSLILFFIKKYNDELAKFAPTLLKKLLDNNCAGEKYILDWHDKTIDLDKESMLYSKKSERKFRELTEDFVQWLQSAEAEVKESSAAEKTTKGNDPESDNDNQITDSKPAETDQQRKRREAIEKQQKQQEEMLIKMKQKAEEEEAQKEAEAESRIDVTKMADNDNVDINDI